MNEQLNGIVQMGVKNQEEVTKLAEKLFSVAQPGTVYSEPVIAGEYTVITASEVSVGMGSAYGVGGGAGTQPAKERAQENQSEAGDFGGGGGGGGGGGAATSRPVAVISVGPQGVRVDPVVDATKIALAFMTALGSMLIMLSKMWRASRR